MQMSVRIFLLPYRFYITFIEAWPYSPVHVMTTTTSHRGHELLPQDNSQCCCHSIAALSLSLLLPHVTGRERLLFVYSNEQAEEKKVSI